MVFLVVVFYVVSPFCSKPFTDSANSSNNRVAHRLRGLIFSASYESLTDRMTWRQNGLEDTGWSEVQYTQSAESTPPVTKYSFLKYSEDVPILIKLCHQNCSNQVS